MLDVKELSDIIKDRYEGDYLDFKATQYKDNMNLIKDVLAMANSFSELTKYIICGIKVKPNNEKEIQGIDSNEFKDSAELQQLIYSNIEPDLHIEYLSFEYEGKLLGIIKIENGDNRPYILKKDFGSLKKGLCYVRKGSHQTAASREDFDRFYFLKV